MFPGLLISMKSVNEVEYLSIFVGKGLIQKFDYCKINSCFELSKPVYILLETNVCNFSFFTDPWKKSELFVRETKWSLFFTRLFITNTAVKLLQVETGHCFFAGKSNWNGSKITVTQLVRDSIFFYKYLFRTAGNFHLSFLLKLKYSGVIRITSSSCCIIKKVYPLWQITL